MTCYRWVWLKRLVVETAHQRPLREPHCLSHGPVRRAFKTPFHVRDRFRQEKDGGQVSQRRSEFTGELVYRFSPPKSRFVSSDRREETKKSSLIDTIHKIPVLGSRCTLCRGTLCSTRGPLS